MLKNSILALTLVVILSACGNQEKPILKGVDGSEVRRRLQVFPMFRFRNPLI